MGADRTLAYPESVLDLRAGLREYMPAFHTAAKALGRIAMRAQPKLLVIYHVILFGTPPSELLDEIRSEFSGTVVIANDLDEV
jgi:ribonuclease Z